MTPIANASVGRSWDAVVVGAGPAGSLAARELAHSGLSTLLVERSTLPRAKVCGGCLNPRALRLLADVGLADLPARLGAVPLHTLRLTARGRSAALALPGGLAISRAKLDAALADAASEAGARLLTGVTASRLDADETGPRIVRLTPTDGGDAFDVAARVVIAADGLGGRWLDDGRARIAAGARIGAGTILSPDAAELPSGEIAMACGRDGYVGITRIEGRALALAAALDGRAVARDGGLAPAIGRVLDEAGLPRPTGLSDAVLRGTPPLTRSPLRRAAYRAFALGDAAGYVEPFTGEGMTWALDAAHAVVPFARAAAADWHASLGPAWTVRWHRLVRRRQGPCRAVARLVRHPRVLSLLLGGLASRPSLATPLLGRFAGEEEP